MNLIKCTAVVIRLDRMFKEKGDCYHRVPDRRVAFGELWKEYAPERGIKIFDAKEGCDIGQEEVE